MTSDQRRPGFRLPWSSSEDEPAEGETGGNTSPADEARLVVGGSSRDEAAAPALDGPGKTDESELEAPAASSSAPAQSTADSQARTAAPLPERDTMHTAFPAPAPSAAASAGGPVSAERPAAPAEPSAGFLRDLVAAMRRVAEETRQSSLGDLRSKSEQLVQRLEADSERQRAELKARAEADIAGVGVWARAEEERIKNEAEQRVVARRAQLDQQLAAEASRAQAEAQALRERLEAYEAELDAYHAQLSDIADPAAFAAAAKRMPPPPHLTGDRVPTTTTPPAAAAPSATAPDATAPSAAEPAVAAPEATAPRAAEPAWPNAAPRIHPAEEEVLPGVDAVRDTPSPGQAPPGPTTPTDGEATDVLVKGLGSFGAITGFRQALASADGVDSVSLSLGPTGEFVFRAIHTAGVDLAAVIAELEGDAATIDERSEGRLRVTLQRSR